MEGLSAVWLFPTHSDRRSAASQCLSLKRLFQEARKSPLSANLHYMHYNFCRLHKTLRVTPGIGCWVTEHVWSAPILSL